MSAKPTYEELEQKIRDLEKKEFARQRTEDALKDSEERFRETIELLPNIVCEYDTNGRITFVNKYGLESLGYTSADLENGLYLKQLFPQEEMSKFRDRFSLLIKGERIPSTEYRLIKKDGSIIDVIATSSPIYSDEKVVGARSSVTPITELKRIERAFRESEELSARLIAAIPDPVVRTDIDGVIQFINEIALQVSGYERSEFIGKNMFSFIAPEDHEKAKRNTLLMMERQLGPVEYRLIMKDGERRHFEVNGDVLRTQEGIPYNLVYVLRDITERKETEEEKTKLEARLVQAQKMEAIGNLAGGIAHDFNNILSAIIGYSELVLADANEGSQLEKNIRGVLKAGSRAKDLVKQILAFSRQSAQELKPIQFKTVVKEVLKLLRATLPVTIEIRQNIESDSIIMADAAQIHQIIMNLCTNAGHAMATKGGTLDISLTDVEIDEDLSAQHPEMRPGSYLELTVKDTGHGMPPDIIERIFEPYFTTKGKGEGTGLGLSVIHGIVKSYKGAVTVQSETDKGSTFNVFLPIIESEASVDEETKEQLPKGKERVLFIDDEPTLVEIANEMLKRLGYNVKTRTSSIEALELFRAHPDSYDLIITDMTMPGMTGDELAKKMIQVKTDIPIILCTGYSQWIDKNMATRLGIRAFLMKPLIMTELAHTVRKVLDKK